MWGFSDWVDRVDRSAEVVVKTAELEPLSEYTVLVGGMKGLGKDHSKKKGVVWSHLKVLIVLFFNQR